MKWFWNYYIMLFTTVNNAWCSFCEELTLILYEGMAHFIWFFSWDQEQSVKRYYLALPLYSKLLFIYKCADFFIMFHRLSCHSFIKAYHHVHNTRKSFSTFSARSSVLLSKHLLGRDLKKRNWQITGCKKKSVQNLKKLLWCCLAGDNVYHASDMTWTVFFAFFLNASAMSENAWS